MRRAVVIAIVIGGMTVWAEEPRKDKIYTRDEVWAGTLTGVEAKHTQTADGAIVRITLTFQRELNRTCTYRCESANRGLIAGTECRFKVTVEATATPARGSSPANPCLFATDVPDAQLAFRCTASCAGAR